MSAPPREATTWALISLCVVLLAGVGLIVMAVATSPTARTVGEGMLTVALVAGPFLWAEAMLNTRRRTPSRPNLSGDLAARDLTGADLSGRYLRRRAMAAARLSDAHLERADLSEAQLDDARLTNAALSGATLQRTSLKSAAAFRADLRDADLTEADLRWANLKEADLRGASLVDADLCNADLRGTDLRDTDLRGASLQGARYSRTTRLPDGLDREAVRLGLQRHADEPEDPGTVRRSRTAVLRPVARVAVLASLVAALSIAITTLAPGGRDQTRVGGVAEDRPYYRVTGDAEQVRLGFRDQRGTRRVVATSLPVSIPAPTEAASIEVTSFDGSAVRCQIRAGGAIQSDAAGDGTVVCTSR